MEPNAWEGPLQQFHHAELRSNTCIRLVQIHAQLFRGDISCTLEHYESDTQTCPDYVALSYVWGDSTPTQTIYINGLVFRVHQSLWEFLNHSRTKKDTEHTWIWTDLLCIDQAHHSEKNEQISRMGDIYAQAAHVLSWLGNNGKTTEALRTIIEMSEEIDTGCPPKYAWRSSKSERIHKACDRLGLEEPYWERVWILQEVARAKSCIVACGDTSVNFGDLLRKMDIAMKRSVRFDSSSDRDRRMQRIETSADLKTSIQQGRTMRLVELIEKTLFCQATREQDRIYGLLGLASRLDPGFDSRALDVSQNKSLIDVWWDIIFMISDGVSNTSKISDLETLWHLTGTLPNPRKPSELEMGSNIRRDHAETASQVSEAAYSFPIQAFLGISQPRRRKKVGFTSSSTLYFEWGCVTEHVLSHERDIPGFQTGLGWSTYAGLEFTTFHQIKIKSPKARAISLPPGWLCAAHLPDPPSDIAAKYLIRNRPMSTIGDSPDEDRFRPAACSGAEHDHVRCDMSLLVLKIGRLGVTCLVRSTETVQLEFYCDCCDPSTASLDLSRYNPVSSEASPRIQSSS